MRRMLPALVLGLLLAPAAVAQTAAQAVMTPKAGTYEVVNFPATGQGAVLGLVKITPKGDGVDGELMTAAPNQRGLTLKGVALEGDTLRITLRRTNADVVFEGRVPQADAETVRGSIVTDGKATAARVTLTDKTELTAGTATAPATEVNSLRQVQTLLRQAGRNKTDVNQVRNWIAEALTAAKPYGPRYENEVAVQIAEALASHGAYAALAVENAQRAERALTAKDSADQQLRVLDTLAMALKSAGKSSDAGTIESRAAKAATDLDREYLTTMPPFKPETYEGRKEKSDRAVVLELFTGAQCPPCVASDVAFDALEKTYKPTDVVLIQYHLHIPGADPMTNATTEARARYYSVSSTPSTFFNGERNASGGGAIAQAQRKYTQFRGILDDLLEKPSGTALKLGAALQGDTITVKADVSKLADPSDEKKLRFVLVEESVRFIGNNKLRYHHMVVRAMPGGADGIALTKSDGQHTASVNLGELRQELTAYLDDYAVNGRRAPFPQPERPLALKGLKAIALVQDDKTKEILQAAIIDVDGVHAAH